MSLSNPPNQSPHNPDAQPDLKYSGERTAVAMEKQLSGLESKVDDLLAAFEKPNKHGTDNTRGGDFGFYENKSSK